MQKMILQKPTKSSFANYFSFKFAQLKNLPNFVNPACTSELK